MAHLSLILCNTLLNMLWSISKISQSQESRPYDQDVVYHHIVFTATIYVFI